MKNSDDDTTKMTRQELDRLLKAAKDNAQDSEQDSKRHKDALFIGRLEEAAHRIVIDVYDDLVREAREQRRKAGTPRAAPITPPLVAIPFTDDARSRHYRLDIIVADSEHPYIKDLMKSLPMDSSINCQVGTEKVRLKVHYSQELKNNHDIRSELRGGRGTSR